MSFNWINTTVGEYSPFIYGKAIRKVDQLSEGTPVYGSNGVYTFSEEPLSEQHAVIIGRKGSVGKVHLSTKPCWISDTAFYTTKDTIEEAYFVYYLLSSLGLEDMNTDAAVPGLNRNNAHRLEIKIPSTVEERVALVEPLIKLDKKIELNRQTNQTLEEIAQAIFKSWFVDFEPTRAKIIAQDMGADTATQELAAQATICGALTLEQLADIEQNLTTTLQEAIHTKLSHNSPTPINAEQLATTAALFPNALVESELGEIPQGWDCVRLDQYIELAYGKALKKADRVEGPYPVYGSGGITGSHKDFLVPGPSIIIGRKGTVGSIYWEDQSFYPIDTTFYVVVKNGCTLSFAYYLLQTLGLDGMNSDAAVPGLNRNNVYRLEVPCYPIEIIERFTKLINSISSKIAACKTENLYLTELRDTLLPKLLSGDLQVNDGSHIA